MKVVLYTQRVEVIENYHERRDCADQEISRFIYACGYLPLPIPNVKSYIREIIETINPIGIVLTGGNSLVKYGGNAPERDEAETELIEIALQKDIPIYGFCRGMQVVLDYFGNDLINVQGHVAVRHQINGKWENREINSYHNQACKEVKLPLKVLAKAEDGVIEAVMHENRKILATMWHPEREKTFNELDIKMIKALFEGE